MFDLNLQKETKHFEFHRWSSPLAAGLPRRARTRLVARSARPGARHAVGFARGRDAATGAGADADAAGGEFKKLGASCLVFVGNVFWMALKGEPTGSHPFCWGPLGKIAQCRPHSYESTNLFITRGGVPQKWSESQAQGDPLVINWGR